MKQNGLEEYLRRAEQVLDCSPKEKKTVLEQVRSMLLDIPEIETMTLEEICETAGPPEELAGETPKTALTWKEKLIRRAIGTVFILGILLFAVWCGIRTEGTLLYFTGSPPAESEVTVELPSQ